MGNGINGDWPRGYLSQEYISAMINQPRGRAKKKKRAPFDVTPTYGFTMDEIKKPKKPEGWWRGRGKKGRRGAQRRKKKGGGCPYWSRSLG